MDNILKLGFINFVGTENDGTMLYDFIFTDNCDEFWGDGFEQIPSCLVNELHPHDEYITEIKRLNTNIKLELAQNNCCFGMQDVLDGICALAYENILDYDEYPQDGRLVLMFGESMPIVEKKLAMKNLLFQN